jgi:hypothetical protein
LAIKLELGVVKVDGGDGGIGLASIGDFGSLWIINENGETAKDDCFDFEEVIGMNPD